MKDLLLNPAVQTAVITVIVVGLNALAEWLKKKFPTQAARVEANWCYLQPVVAAAMAGAQGEAAKSPIGSTVTANIIARAVAEFADSYRQLEGKDATEKEIAAARSEITAAVSRVTGG